MQRIGWVLLVFIAISLLLRFQTFFIPIYNGDETNHTCHAFNILEGKLPYESTVEKKPPLLYYLYALIFLLIPDLRFLHIFMAFWVALSGFCLYWAGRQSGYRPIGFITGMLYIAYSMAFVEEDMWASNIEVWANGFVCAGIGFYFSAPKKNVLSLSLTGCLLGLASLCKHQYLMSVFPFLVLTVIHQDYVLLWRNKIYASIYLIVGNLFPIFLSILWAWHQGIIVAFYEYVVWENFRYLHRTQEFLRILWVGMERTVLYLLAIAPLVALSVVVFRKYGNLFLKGIRGFWRGDGRWRGDGCWSNPMAAFSLFGILWIVFIFSAISAGGRFYGHYFLQWLPGWAILGGIGLYLLLNSFGKRFFIIALIIPVVGFQLVGFIRTYTRDFEGYSKQLYSMVDTARQYACTNEPVFIWGNCSQIYYLGPFKPASRFVTCEYLVPYREQVLPEEIMKTRSEQLMRDLIGQPPMLIIDTSYSDFFPYWKGIHWGQIPALQAWIHEYYECVDSVEGVDVYALRHDE